MRRGWESPGRGGRSAPSAPLSYAQPHGPHALALSLQLLVLCVRVWVHRVRPRTSPTTHALPAAGGMVTSARASRRGRPGQCCDRPSFDLPRVMDHFGRLRLESGCGHRRNSIRLPEGISAFAVRTPHVEATAPRLGTRSPTTTAGQRAVANTQQPSG
jgi:hypothetical protein